MLTHLDYLIKEERGKENILLASDQDPPRECKMDELSNIQNTSRLVQEIVLTKIGKDLNVSIANSDDREKSSMDFGESCSY